MEDFIFSEGERKVLEEVLDEQERTYLQHFADDERLFNAVSKALLIPMYGWGVLKKGKKPRTDINFVNSYVHLDDQKLGQAIRSVNTGMFYIEKGLALIKTLKKPKENKVENKIEAE